MSVKSLSFAALAIVALGWSVAPAMASSTTDCSAKYAAAKTAGTLNGMTWNAFRKAQCGTAATAAAATTATTATAAAPSASEPTAATTENAPEPAAPTMIAPKNVIFPKAVSSKYASETPAKQRMHTCLDQYRTDKSANGLGGLTWIQKGGGFYSLCNAKLKG